MDRAPDRLPTTQTGEPVATVPSGPIQPGDTSRDIAAETEEANQNAGQGVRFEVPDPSSDDQEEEEEEEEEGEGEESDHEMDVDETELHPASVRV